MLIENVFVGAGCIVRIFLCFILFSSTRISHLTFFFLVWIFLFLAKVTLHFCPLLGYLSDGKWAREKNGRETFCQDKNGAMNAGAGDDDTHSTAERARRAVMRFFCETICHFPSSNILHVLLILSIFSPRQKEERRAHKHTYIHHSSHWQIKQLIMEQLYVSTYKYLCIHFLVKERTWETLTQKISFLQFFFRHFPDGHFRSTKQLSWCYTSDI